MSKAAGSSFSGFIEAFAERGHYARERISADPPLTKPITGSTALAPASQAATLLRSEAPRSSPAIE
jgi:hypothetical protein